MREVGIGNSEAHEFDGHSSAVSPVRLNPELPPGFERILNKALEKDRELRTGPLPSCAATCNAALLFALN